MNTRIVFIIIVFVLRMFTSCGDMLELQLYGVVTLDDFYRTPADAERAVTEAYKIFQTLDGHDGRVRAGWMATGDVLSADVQGHPDIAVYYQMQQSIVQADAGHVLMHWQIGMNGIYMANLAMGRIQDIEMDATLKNRYMGELLFIRGFFMFRLGMMFGTAPVITGTLDINELNMPNSSRTQTRVPGKAVNSLRVNCDLFDQAEKDFREALTKGMANRNTGALLGRADNASVKACLVQVCLYGHRWQEAKPLLEDIMSYGYQLLPDYNHLFNGEHDNSSESVFEVQFAALNQKETDNFGTMLYAPNAGGFVTGGGWGWTRPTPDIVSEYEEGDPRLVASIFRPDIDDFNGKVYRDISSGWNYGHRKFCIGPPGFSDGVSIDGETWYNSCNFPLVRYAEVLLWYAEVLNELGDRVGAARHVNMVRKRTATTTNPNTVNITPTWELAPMSEELSYEEMFWAIVHERRIELAFEGKFGWDLRRWGIAREVLRDPNRWQNRVFDANFFKYEDGKDEILPVPQLEIDRSQGMLRQNHGYPQ